MPHNNSIQGIKGRNIQGFNKQQRPSRTVYERYIEKRRTLYRSNIVEHSLNHFHSGWPLPEDRKPQNDGYNNGSQRGCRQVLSIVENYLFVFMDYFHADFTLIVHPLLHPSKPKEFMLISIFETLLVSLCWLACLLSQAFKKVSSNFCF